MLNYHLDIGEDFKWYIGTKNKIAENMPHRIEEAGRFRAGKDFFIERSGRPSYLFLYTISGSGALTFGRQTIELTRQTAVLIDCTQYHKFATASTEPWEFIWFHIVGTKMREICSMINGNKISVIILGRTTEFFKSIQKILKNAENSDIISLAETSHEISALLTQMLISEVRGETQKRLSHQTDVEKAMQFINANYHRQISIEDITSDINISKYHFIRLFKKHTGTTPYHYLISVRIDHAKQLLCTSEETISTIAAMVGYVSESNFINQFKQLVRVTPAKYRSSNARFNR